MVSKPRYPLSCGLIVILGGKSETNVFRSKSRHIILLAKVPTVKALVFLVVMYRCENWTRKKAERQRTDASKLC